MPRVAVVVLVVLWAIASYCCGFLACVKIIVPTFVFRMPDEIGRYAYFSTNRYIGECLHFIFRPCVWVLEEAQLCLYLPQRVPTFYNVGHGLKIGVPTGWEYALRGGGQPFTYIAIGVAFAELVTTGLLAYLMWRHCRGRRQQQSAEVSSGGGHRDTHP